MCSPRHRTSDAAALPEDLSHHRGEPRAGRAGRWRGLAFRLGILAGAAGVRDRRRGCGCGAAARERGLTRRLERLQAGVETLGSGNLTARVAVQGRDEVARLAESFNRAAGRIEDLVGAHRMLLANASHELRTPLSRIRLALDLFERSGEAKYKADLERDINELEGLIEEILLASRLDAMPALQTTEDIDLLALAAEE